MENTLHATSHADQSMASSTIRPTLQNCIVPVAPTCFLLQASAGVGIATLTAHIHEIAKTYHAYGAANLTFIVSDAQALERDCFFAPAAHHLHRRAAERLPSQEVAFAPALRWRPESCGGTGAKGWRRGAGQPHQGFPVPRYPGALRQRHCRPGRRQLPAGA